MQPIKQFIKKLISYLTGKWIADEIMLFYKDVHVDVPKIGGYIRLKTLELAIREIYENNVRGNIAEVGVFKGDFAKVLNASFPDRKLYLFDTFDGFDKRDVQVEETRGYSSGKQDFSETSIELVLSKMKFKEQCIIHKGYFPDSLNGLEDTFAFVSLDPDLYKPILDGLEYFYPRLSPGGFIFIHDYNNSEYPGAKQAVKEFSKKHNITYVPVSDACGTAIVRK